MEIRHLTSADFDDVVNGSRKPVMIDFWATWCGPCAMMAPVIDEVAATREDIAVCKVDVDEQPSLAVRYKVSSIPTVLLFKNGVLTGKCIGFTDKDTLLKKLGVTNI